ASSVSVTNTDNDTAGLTVSTISANTTEAGGTATFTVRLNSQPNGNVILNVSSSNTNEGTLSVSTLTFSISNWNTTQTVTVTGVNDSIADGNQAYTVSVTVASTTDTTGYATLSSSSVSVTNTDNDTAGLTIPAISGNTTEAGGTATFTVKLNSQPTGNVVLNIASSNTNEGTVSPSTLTFITSTWNDTQTVTVTGVNDSVADGNQTYSISVSIDTTSTTDTSGYASLAASSVSVTNDDNDSAGFSLSATSGTTTEAGTSSTFTVQLTSQPTANVSFNISSNDTTEGTVTPSSMTFTSSNWNTAQTLTVIGQPDDLGDGTVSYSIVLAAATSSDATYNSLNPSDITMSNTADNTAPTVSTSSLSVASVTSSSIALAWTAASDTVTTTAALQYKVVYSTSNNISTVTDAGTNGTTAMNYTANTTSYNITGLTGSTTYYVNVLVKDTEGNVNVYTSTSQATSFGAVVTTTSTSLGIGTGTTANMLDAVALANDRIFVVYAHDSPTANNALYAIYDSALTQLSSGAVTNVSAVSSAELSRISVTKLSGGNIVVGYVTSNTAYFKIYDVSSSTLGNELTVKSSNNPIYPVKVVALTGGGFAYVYNDVGLTNMYVGIYSATGQVTVTPTIAAVAADSPYYLDATPLSTGGFAVAYSKVATGVYYSTFNSSGTRLVGPVSVDAVTQNVKYITISAFSDDKVLITYEGSSRGNAVVYSGASQIGSSVLFNNSMDVSYTRTLTLADNTVFASYRGNTALTLGTSVFTSSLNISDVTSTTGLTSIVQTVPVQLSNNAVYVFHIDGSTIKYAIMK
ncbi:MAG: fibronectin type III domain-containing protein, partial [SAR324 cluster bacterium]|nr:fibronectin type III domain-containing protein [SAR324 cluster bacterium]